MHLDGKPVRTPGKALLALPTEEAAALVADEFAAQGETIDPVTMPVMRLVNTAIDGVASDPQAVLEDILRFASSDLLCYRADAPQGLVDRQNEHWDPVIDWARGDARSSLQPRRGHHPCRAAAREHRRARRPSCASAPIRCGWPPSMS